MVDRCGYYTISDSNSENSNTNTNLHPSFSSTLLDAIYRSIDQGENEIVMYGETTRKKKTTMFRTEEEIANFQRACMIEKWMEKKAGEKVAAARRKSAAADSSWDSSGGGGGAGFLSSSDADSFYEKRPKPIRVCDDKDKSASRHDKTSKNQEAFMKTKSRALKIYAELKKVKQPISPGARLAGFLNSLFTAAGNYTKKPKMNNPETNSPILKSANASTCSSASSFSRSCLSKTPSSRGKSAGGEKRTVRFSPESVIVDEDCQPCGHREMNVNRRKQNLEAINEEIMVHVMEKSRRVEEAARDFLRNYQKKMDHEFRLDHFTKSQEFDDDDDDEDDDAASHASSDLFELDNLSAIGMERYREELPVYETTRLHTIKSSDCKWLD